MMPDLLPPAITRETEHWPTQLEGYWHASNSFRNLRPGVLLDMAMGSGKSRVVIDVAQNMGSKYILVLAPKSVVAVWPFQVLRWAASPDDWNVTVLGDSKPNDEEEPLPVHWKFEKGSVGARARLMRERYSLSAGYRHNLFVVNWESCWREAMAGPILVVGWELLIADEVHRIKAARSRVSLFASKLQKKMPATPRIGMSGTCMPTGPLDAFGIMRFVAPSLFGHSVTVFRNTYLYTNPYIGGGRAVLINPKTKDWFKGKGERRRFEEVYGSVTYRAEKNLDNLPPLTEVSRWAELEPAARRHYIELLEEMYTEVRSISQGKTTEQAVSELVVSNAMVLVTRLQQLLSGFIVDEEGVKHNVSQAKANLLREVLEDIGPHEPVVIFARFVDDIQIIREAIEATGRKCGEVSGRRKDVRGVWRASDGFDALAVQIQSGSVGVDYTHACYSIFWSVWGGGDFAQARDRIHRPPQKRPVTQINLVTKRIKGAVAVDYQLISALGKREDLLRTVARNAIEAARQGTL